MFTCFLTSNVQSQIKVFPNNKISFGTTIAPSNFGVNKIFITNKMAFAKNTNTIISSGLIRGNNNYSSALTPDFTWYNNDVTGFYHPALNKIGLSVSGIERVLVSNIDIKINSLHDWYHTLYIKANTPNTVGYHMQYGGQDNFYVHASGWIYCQGSYIHSDSSFKKDVYEIPDALSKVMELEGVYYKLNYSDSMAVFNNDENQIGLIAQQVEKVVPEVVKTMHDGTKAIAYQNLVALLIEAVKEQQYQIEELKNNSFKSTGLANNPNQNNFAISKNVLFQNRPNPFNSKTTIKYSVTNEINNAQIFIFNMQGTLITTFKIIEKGTGQITINSSELNAGMYMYSLIVDGKLIDTKRMILTQ